MSVPRPIVIVVLLLMALGGNAEPIPYAQLQSVFPMGAKVGAEVEVAVFGQNLEGEHVQLLFSHPGIIASPVMLPADRFYPVSRPAPGRFIVHIGADVQSGLHELRLSNRLGVSNARWFAVDRLPEFQAAVKQPGDNANANATKSETIASVPVDSIINGVCSPQSENHYRFSGKRGQRLILHCAAQRLDSRADVVMTLANAAGSRLRDTHDPVWLDPTMDFTVPQDGEYVIGVHDYLYRGGNDFSYRLTLSTGPWIDFIEPPFATAGATAQHILYGRNLPGGSPAGIRGSDGQPLDKLAVTIAAPKASGAVAAVDTMLRPADGSIATFSYHFEASGGMSSNSVRLALLSGASIVEQEPNDTPEHAQGLVCPAQVVGRFHPRGDRDWYTFEARKGERYWIEVLSHRLGLPTDPHLLVQQVSKDAAGKHIVKDIAEVDDVQQQQGEDQRFRLVSDDPVLSFTAPGDGTYRVLVEDLFGRGQSESCFFYLLTVRATAKEDFRLLCYAARPDPSNGTIAPYTPVLRRGGTTEIDVTAMRQDGFNAEIRVAIEGLPVGVSAAPVVIGPGSNSGVIVLRATSDAANFDGSVRIVGRATASDGAEIVQGALPVEVLSRPVDGANRAPTRAVRQLPLSVRDDATVPLSISLGEASKVYRVPRGGKLPLSLKVQRAGSPQGASIQISFRGQPQTVRIPQGLSVDAGTSEKPVELDIDPSTPVGSFSLIAHGELTMQYERDPMWAKQLAADKLRIDAIAQQNAKDLQKAVEMRQKAEQDVQQTAAASAQADQELAAAQSKPVADTLAKATAGATAAKQKAAAAVLSKQAATEAETRSREEVRSAEEARRVAEQSARQATDAARAREAKFLVSTPPILIEIVPAPFKIRTGEAIPTVIMTAGGPTAQLPISVERDAPFDDEIRFELVSQPGGPSGVRMTGEANLIPTSKASGTMTIQAEKSVPAGKYPFTLRARYRFNGRDLSLDLPFNLTINAAR